MKFVIWFPVVIVAAFAAGYLFWQKTLIPGPYDLGPVSMVRHQTAESLDTSGWQIYRNEKYGFEVKYPVGWNAFDEIVAKGSGELPGESLGFNYYKVKTSSADDVIFSPLNLTDENIFWFQDQYIEINLQNEFLKSTKTLDDFWSTFEIDTKNEFQEKISFDGENFILFLQHGIDTVSRKWASQPRALFVYKGNFFLISYAGESPEIFRNVLSRFKFIKPGSKEDKVCIQVITRAKNPQTGEVRDFPTPCDVPEGWETIK